MDYARTLRLGLVVLGVPNLVTGAWALFFPRSWYLDFPGRDLGWIAAFGDYNEHFIQDIGSAYLAFGTLLLSAAALFNRRAAQVALIGFLVFAMPHFLVHVFVREDLSTRGYLGTLALLGIAIVLALWLLVLSQRVGTSSES
jgi:hypothetical protein